MKTKNVLAMALLAAGLFTSEVAQAKKKPVANPATTANGDILRYRKVTKLDFEGSTMTGNVEKPMMSLFWGKRRRKMKSLITFRKNFRERLASTAASL